MQRATVFTLAFVVLLGGTSLSQAQSGHADREFQIRVGGFLPEGGGEFWDESESTFTLDIDDFDGAAIGFTYLGSLTNYLELGVNLDFYEEEVVSAYRGFVDGSGFEILHDSTLSRVPLTVDFRFVPTGRYRSRPGGRQVLKPLFYVGGGAGINFWEYEEVGDFLDFQLDPPEIFFDRFVDDGEALELHVLAGVELPLSPQFNLVLEGRRSWSDDDLGEGFAGLGEIELGGTSVYIGGGFRF